MEALPFVNATITVRPTRSAPPRDIALEIATNKARGAIATLDLHRVRFTMEQALAEQTKVLRELDGVGISQGLRAKHDTKVEAARKSGPRGEPSVAPAMTAYHAKQERRPIELEGVVAACQEQIEVLEAEAAAELARQTAAAEEARLWETFRAEEAEAAAAAERERFDKWKAELGL
jgi:hypothetical protein